MSNEANRLPLIIRGGVHPQHNINTMGARLAKRLYRNNSMNRMSHNNSVLSLKCGDEGMALSNDGEGIGNQSQLVAGVSLKKGKRGGNQQMMEISNGRVIINRSPGQVKEGGGIKKKMFKKLEKLSWSPENRILPDDLIDYPLEKQLQVSSRSKLLKKSSLCSSNSKKLRYNTQTQQHQQQLFPQDFIQLLFEDGNITNEFCYLQKMDHSYDLKIVEFDKNFERRDDGRKMQLVNQYITISGRGITYFSQQQPRFVPLEEWVRQAGFFRKIVKLDFFRNFKIIKNFSNWKKYIRKSAMKATMQKLKQKLMVNDKYLRLSLLQARRICIIMESDVSYCRFDECQRVANFWEFKSSQEAFIQNQFQQRIMELEENIKAVLIHNMTESMKEFKEENKISSSVEGKGMPLLIGDEKNLEMPYTKEATLRTQQEKFQKFIKLINLLITNSKVNMMSESTLVLIRKIQQQNDNYQKQVIESNYTLNFKGVQFLQCVLILDPRERMLMVKPTLEDLGSLFEDIVNRSVVRLCRNHRKITSDGDILAVIYDNQEQYPKQSQSQSLKVIMTSEGKQEEMHRLIMNVITISYNHILKYVDRFKQLAQIHYENSSKLQEIEGFESKDHESISNLIEKWQKEKEMIYLIGRQHDGPVFQLNLKQFKQKAEKTTNACITKIKQVIPRILQDSIRELHRYLDEGLEEMENQPLGTPQALIQFNKNKAKLMGQIDGYSDCMMEISCLEILIRNFAISNPQSSSFKKYQKDIRELQLALNLLRRKLDQAELNNKRYEAEVQKQMKQMQDKNVEGIKLIYRQIQGINKQKRQIDQMMVLIKKSRQDLGEIVDKFQRIKSYQQYLNIGVVSDQRGYISFIHYFQVFEKIWSTVYRYECYASQIENGTWGLTRTAEINSRLEEYISILLNLEKEVVGQREKDQVFQFSGNDLQVVRETLGRIEESRPILEVIEYLNDRILGQKQWREIRSVIQSTNPNLSKILQRDHLQVTIAQLKTQNIVFHLPYLKDISCSARKNCQISKKLELIKYFCNFSKQHLGVFRNLGERFLGEIGIFMKELDEKIIMSNFVVEEMEYSDGRERVRNDRGSLEKLKQILMLWNQYEEHVGYFQPIYGATDWKNTQEGKLFIAATQQNWKKTYRSYKDCNLSKILSAERIIPSLKQSNEILQSLYPSMNSFFNNKRIQNTRMYFLSDQDIITIHSQNKDFRGLNSYISKIFPTIKQLLIKQDQQIPYDVINKDGESLILKFGRISSFETEQMIRATEQGIKNGIKYSLKNCYINFDTEQFNRMNWIKQNQVQVVIFMVGVYFTKIMEQDYLRDDGDDMDKLYGYHLGVIDQIRGMMGDSREGDEVMDKKLGVILTQGIAIRDIINQLINKNITSKQSYEWVKQVRHYYNVEQVSVEYLNVSMSYGNEFVCMFSNPLLITTLNERAIIQLVNTIFCCNNVPIVSKSFLPQLAVYNAKPYINICVASNNQINILESTILGTWLSGSLTDLILPSNTSLQQLKVIGMLLHQVQLAITLKQPYLYGLRNMVLCRQSGISLICPSLMSSPLLKQCYFDYRVISYQKIKWSVYIQMLFEVYGINIPNLGKKLAKLIQYLEKALPEIIISYNTFKNWIEAISTNTQTENSIIQILMKQINRKDLKNCKRKLISKIFTSVFGIISLQNLTQGSKSSKLIKQLSQSENQINKLLSTLEINRVCLIVGKGSYFRDFIIYMGGSQYCGGEKEMEYLSVSEYNLRNLLGYYDENGRWIDGTLTHEIMTSFYKRKWFILSGLCSKTIINLLQKLNICNNFVNLENGQRLSLGLHQRIIFISQINKTDPLLTNCQLKLYDWSHIKFLPQDILKYLTKCIKLGQNPSPFDFHHFSKTPEVYNSLCNLYLNNYEKFSLSNLKALGYKSQYMDPQVILGKFIVIVNAGLGRDSEKICCSNQKMMERMFVWGLFWAVGASLPERCIQRLEKIFDLIKIEMDKSQSLSETRFMISERSQSICRFIKSYKIFENGIGGQFIISPKLQAKKQLIKLLVLQNSHVMLVGNKGAGKTTFLNYLQSQFRLQGYSTIELSLTRKTTLIQFFSSINQKIYLQYQSNDRLQRYKLCSGNGTKLVFLVDNINMLEYNSQIFQFFKTSVSLGYFYDRSKNCRILIGDVVFICAINGGFETVTYQHSYCQRNYFAVWINEIDLNDIIQSYDEILDKIMIEQQEQILHKILNAIGSVHQFVNGIVVGLQKEVEKKKISYQIPIWIIKQVINRSKDGRYSVREIVSLWKYITIKKYVESGRGLQFEKQIKKEIENIISLIAKNSHTVDQFLKQQKLTVSELIKYHPLLNLKYDYSEYYYFITFMMESQQFKHVISHSQSVYPKLKYQSLVTISEEKKIKCYHIRKLKEFNQIKLQNAVVYIDGNDGVLIESIFGMIVGQKCPPDVMFVVDFGTREELLCYLRFYPQIEDYTHIVDVEYQVFSKQEEEIQNYGIIVQLFSYWGIKCDGKLYEQLFCLLDQNIKKVKIQLLELVTRRKTILQGVVDNFQALNVWVEQCSKQEQQLKKQMSDLTIDQQQKLDSKGQLVNTLSKLKKNNSESNYLEKQVVNRNLNDIDIELKRIRNLKKQKYDQLMKLKENCEEKVEVHGLLQEYQKVYVKDYQICNELYSDSLKIGWLIIIEALVNLHYEYGSHPQLIKMFNGIPKLCSAKLTHRLLDIYSCLLGGKIGQIKQGEILIVRILNGVKDGERIIEKREKLSQKRIGYVQCQYVQHLGMISSSKKVEEESFRLIEFLQTEISGGFSVIEIGMLNTELIRLQNENNCLVMKLKQKLQSEKSQFLSSNFISDVKQIFQTIAVFKKNIKLTQQKIEGFMKDLQLRYGKILQKCKKISQYFELIRRVYPYANFNIQHYFAIIGCSIVFKQVNHHNQRDEDEIQESSKQINIEETLKKISEKVCQWVCICLTAEHAVRALFIIAVYDSYEMGAIDDNEIACIGKFFQSNFEKNQTIYIKNNKKLEQTLETLQKDRQNRIFTMIEFSQQMLKIDFMSLLAMKEKWIAGICNLLEQNVLAYESNKPLKVVMIISSPTSNSFKLVDKQLRQYLTNDQNILYISQSEQIQHRLQILQKVIQSQQGWLVLNNCKKADNINKIIEFIQDRNYKVVFMFERIEQYLEVKQQINSNRYYQVSLYNKAKSVCYQTRRIIAKHHIDNASGQINKMLKMMAFDQIYKMCKGFDDPVYHSTSYSYRILQFLLKRCPKITSMDLISFSFDYYYQQQNVIGRVFLNQVKKLTKNTKISQILDDGILPQCYHHTSQTLEQIIEYVNREDKLKKLFGEIIPEKYSRKISMNFLYYFEQDAKVGEINRVEKINNKQFLRIETLLKLKQILQKAPILNKSQSSQKAALVHLDMLFNEKKMLQQQYSYKINTLKRLKIVIESNVCLSIQTEGQLLQIQNSESESMLQKLLDIDRKIQKLQKLIESKQQVNLQMCLQLVNNPSQFLYVFMMECRLPVKFDWSQLEIHMKCIAEKEKESTKEHSVIHFYNMKLNNAKFEIHKNYIESVEEGQISKLNHVLVYFGKEEMMGNFNWKVPLIVNGYTVGEIVIVSKAKESGFRICQVTAAFMDKK